MNYHDHAEEARKAGIPIPQTQVWFNKQVSCIAGPFDDGIHPSVFGAMRSSTTASSSPGRNPTKAGARRQDQAPKL